MARSLAKKGNTVACPLRGSCIIPVNGRPITYRCLPTKNNKRYGTGGHFHNADTINLPEARLSSGDDDGDDDALKSAHFPKLLPVVTEQADCVLLIVPGTYIFQVSNKYHPVKY